MVTLTHNFNEIIVNLKNKTTDFKVPLNSFYGYMIGQTELTFRKLGTRAAGRFRGVSWAWFSPIRTKSGKLLDPVGRRVRHSGTKVRARSRILQDRGRLAAAALAQFRVTDNTLEAETPLIYANWQNAARPFAFIDKKDIEVLREMLVRHVAGGESGK